MSTPAIKAKWVPALVFLNVWVGILLGGCGRGSEIPLGCASGDKVPKAVRNEVVAAAEAVYERMAGGRWQEIYDDAAEAVRKQRTADQFLTPMAQVARRIGTPRDAAVDYISVVRFGERFPYRLEVECDVEGADGPAVLLLADHPVQATLVQTAVIGGEVFFFSTLWHRDNELWKLAGFFAKPASWAGKGWKEYEEEATAQRLAKNFRNSALLYNVAIDLVVPNVWVKPPEVLTLERKQGRLNVTDLPIGEAVIWISAPDTFKVLKVAYDLVPNQLGVSFQYEAGGSADTTAQAAYADRLCAYIRENFPAYSEVFSTYSLLATDPANPQNVVRRTYPAVGNRR